MPDTSILEPAEVAAWLEQNTAFFVDYPQLAMRMQLPRDEGGATSLQSYQIDVLRDKNRELTRRLRELVEIAHENEQLMVRVHTLTLALLRARTLAESARAIAASLSEDFSTDLVRLCLFRNGSGLDALPAAEWLLLADEAGVEMGQFKDFIERGDPVCGRLHPDKLDFLFAARASEVRSAALLSLPGQGLLAIASEDAARFHPGMGTVFLKLLAEVASSALGRHRHS